VLAVVKMKGTCVDPQLHLNVPFGNALKYARNGLNQDQDCLKAAGLIDMQKNIVYDRPEKAILSVKISLNSWGSTYANEFARAMKKDRFLKDFQTFNPTFGSKPNCDENLDYTSMDNPCRGKLATCKFPNSKNATTDADGKRKPGETSCWRYSFRFHQK